MPQQDTTTWITTRDLTKRLRTLEDYAEAETEEFGDGIRFAIERLRDEYDIGE